MTRARDALGAMRDESNLCFKEKEERKVGKKLKIYVM